MSCWSRVIACVVLPALLAISAWAQDRPANAPAPPRAGIMTMHGMAGIVSSVEPAQMKLDVPEHVTFLVRAAPSTEITENGQRVSIGDIHEGNAVTVRGAFDMQALTIDAENIELMPARALHLLRLRTANFGKTWTAGTAMTVESGAIVVQRMDGKTQTVQLDADTAYKSRGETATAALLREGVRVDVQLRQHEPDFAGRVFIQGIMRR